MPPITSSRPGAARRRRERASPSAPRAPARGVVHARRDSRRRTRARSGTSPAMRRTSDPELDASARAGRGAAAHAADAARPAARSASFAKPTQVTSDSTSSGAASGRPCSSVTDTPSSRAISSVQRSYGWQHSAAPPAPASRSKQRPQVGDEAIVAGHQLVELAAGARCTGPRSTAPCPAAAARAAPRTTSSSIAASSSRAPGKNRAIVANPCAIVVGARRPQIERRARRR